MSNDKKYEAPRLVELGRVPQLTLAGHEPSTGHGTHLSPQLIAHHS